METVMYSMAVLFAFLLCSLVLGSLVGKLIKRGREDDQ